MSGVFGMLDSKADAKVPQFLDSVRAQLSHFPWYVAETFVSPDVSVGLGRVGIGIFNREPQPVTSADGKTVLFMAGELREIESLVTRLRAANASPRNTTHPELALCAFEVFGPHFARELDGDFIIAIFDSGTGQLILTNDRFGLYPTFYACEGGKLVFAPEVKGVLCAPFVSRKLNVVAAAEYFRFQQLLGEKTFHEGVLLFPYASVGQFDLKTGQWTVSRYWDWDQIPENLEVRFEDAVAEAGRLLRRAVESRSSDALRPGVFLSGGLDSRTLLGMIPRRSPAPVSASFGARDSRDVYYAKKIARAVGSQHYWFDLADGRWVLDNVDLHLALTEGFHSWIHMHGITMLPTLRDVMDYNLTGWAGTVLRGYLVVDPKLNQPVDDNALLVELYHIFAQRHTWPGLTEAEERLLYTPEFGKQAIGLAFESITREFKEYAKFRETYRLEYFYQMNHSGRMLINMVTTARSHLEFRFPMWDYQLVDFIYSTRPEFRSGSALYRHVITREVPKLATIPYDREEFLPTVARWQHDIQALSVRVRRRLGIYPKRATLYADYENYLRHALRTWAEDILFDPRTEQRGIWNMKFVRSLIGRHTSGREMWTIGKIAPLITFEMMMRKHFD
jgi:asparagine synthase (glutamine-hydrolysing)